MRKAQRQYLRYLRRVLGDALRKANGTVEPLLTSLELGYRWEAEENLTAMIAAQDLADTARVVADKVEEFVERYDKSLTTVEKEWLVGPKRKKGGGAVNGMREGARFLDDIDGRKMVDLTDRWERGEKVPALGHERYFMQRFGGAMKVLRMSWSAMFYAAQKPSVRRMVLTEKETKGYYNRMSDVRKSVHKEADETAEGTGRYVEVYDAEGDLVYVAQPPSSLDQAQSRAIKAAQRQRKAVRGDWSHKPKAPATTYRVDGSPEQIAAVEEIIVQQPGTPLRDAAAMVGVGVYEVEVMKSNPSDDEEVVDAVLFDELWDMPY
jgi:hypothetical protein